MSTKHIYMALDYSQIIYCTNIRDSRSNFFQKRDINLITCEGWGLKLDLVRMNKVDLR